MRPAPATGTSMKLLIACLCFSTWALSAPAQRDNDLAAVKYEAAPSVPVAQVVRSDYLSGKTYRLTENADAEGMLYSFSMWTPFGWYRPESLAMLGVRIRESYALAALNSMKDDPLFLEGITDSARGTVKTTARAITHPIETLRSVPMGLEKFASGVQARADEGDVAGESGRLRNMPAKRQLAAELGIDPYTDNAQLQDALNTVVGHKNSGALVAKIGGAAAGGVGLIVAQTNQTLQTKLRDMSAPELQKANRRALLALGCSPAAVDGFLDCRGYTATRTTAITDAMTGLAGVDNIGQYLTFMKPANKPEVPLFHEQQIEMAKSFHQRVHKLKSFSIVGNTGVFTDSRGEKNIFAPVDVVYWSPDLDRRLQWMQEEGTSGNVHLWIAGLATDAARENLAKGGVTVHERAGRELLWYVKFAGAQPPF
jgi:hypothetical protein